MCTFAVSIELSLVSLNSQKQGSFFTLLGHNIAAVNNVVVTLLVYLRPSTVIKYFTVYYLGRRG